MKKLFRICLFLSIIFVPQVSQSLTTMPPTETDEIVLMGSLDNSSTRSLLPIPICATIGSSSLNAEFSDNLGIISVEVSSPSGSLIYENTVNTNTQQSLMINVTDWDSGVYQIRFENSDGQYMSGTFEIEP